MSWPQIFGVLAFLAFVALLAWIWRREARRPFDEFTGEVDPEP